LIIAQPVTWLALKGYTASDFLLVLTRAYPKAFL
jgi:hypothetical protein